MPKKYLFLIWGSLLTIRKLDLVGGTSYKRRLHSDAPEDRNGSGYSRKASSCAGSESVSRDSTISTYSVSMELSTKHRASQGLTVTANTDNLTVT